MTVFISYSDKDVAVYTALCIALDSSNIRRWDAGEMSPGYSLSEQLRYAINDCGQCVFIATSRSIESQWCLAELGAFWAAGKTVILFLADPDLEASVLPPQFRGNLHANDANRLIEVIRNAEAHSSTSLAKFEFIEGEKASAESLIRLTLQEERKIRVTRFNPRKIQHEKRYFDAMVAKILGESFDNVRHARVGKYCRLTALNSVENRQSLQHMGQMFLERGCNNLVLRVTADKNDFELLIFDQLRVAGLCFHDLSQQDVVHSCLITRDPSLFSNFEQLYHKLWNEDTLLQIDFSAKKDVVRKQLASLADLPSIEKSQDLSRIGNIKHESELKIKVCELLASSN